MSVSDPDMFALLRLALGDVDQVCEHRDVFALSEQSDVAPFGEERVAPGNRDGFHPKLIDCFRSESGKTELFLHAVGGLLRPRATEYLGEDMPGPQFAGREHFVKPNS